MKRRTTNRIIKIKKNGETRPEREHRTCCVHNCTIALSINHTITHRGQLARATARANGCWPLRSGGKGLRARSNKSNERPIERMCEMRQFNPPISLLLSPSPWSWAIGEWNGRTKLIKSLIWRSIWTIHNFLHFHARHTWFLIPNGKWYYEMRQFSIA